VVEPSGVNGGELEVIESAQVNALDFRSQRPATGNDFHGSFGGLIQAFDPNDPLYQMPQVAGRIVLPLPA
jgi:hypothetical protein